MNTLLRISFYFLVLLFVGDSICLAQSHYGSYQPAIEGSIDQMYQANSQKPLGGLFAPEFTRTLTLMGGANFLDTGPNVSLESGGDLPGSGFGASSGSALSFAFGRRHNYRLRSEIELALRENDVSVIGPDETLRAYSVMKNFLFDLQTSSRFTPYVGAGLGWSSIELDRPGDAFDNDAGTFSYQAIGGVATKLSRAADLVVEYRFFESTEANLNDDINLGIAYRAHNIFLGLKFEY